MRRSLKSALRHPALHRPALRAGAARKHGLALLVHRISDEGPQPHEVVRSVPEAVFRRQVEALVDVGDVVPAAVLAAEPAGGTRPRFALTFDDDYPSQLRAAEILAGMAVPGTFFLSGRCLHGLGPYWWELLETEILEHGADQVADRLRLPRGTPQELAAACEGTELASQLASQADGLSGSLLTTADIRSMSTLPGITIGFHTVHHHVLPTLGSRGLHEALWAGRPELAELVRAPIDLLAYPHGKATRPIAVATATAGYRYAWTGRIQPTTPSSHPHLLGRWEPHDLPHTTFLAQLAVRLNITDSGSRSARMP